ncbi:MAG: exonuclease SbcCD subunit D [Microthrixaceae bacterium]
MRLLHTSDWHLGRLMDKASLLDEQAAAIDRTVEIARDEQVDLVVISGDLYDRAIPPAPAVELFGESLSRLRDTGAHVVAISGNHDSTSRVGFADQLLARAGVTVRADVRRAADPVLVTPRDGGPPVAVYPIPYLDPLSVAPLVPAPDPTADGTPATARPGHVQVLDWALQRARRHQRSGPAAGLRSVVVAHAFVTNTRTPAAVSASERELAIGGADQVDTCLFDGFDYVALGHLHGQQSWDDGRVAYSGTPLPYSFSEEHHTKGVRVVELGEHGGLAVRSVALGVGRPLRTLTGTLEQLLADPAHATAESARVRAVLTDPILPSQSMAQLRRRFPHASELVHLPSTAAASAAPALSATRVREATPYELTLDFVTEQLGDRPDPVDDELLRHAVLAATGADR